ncbi:MAG: hypothetical protein K2M22_12510, partial [Lachnospiraceae bacterium]|nr:hypothetical protein [Lachnospiraceae bacterium]
MILLSSGFVILWVISFALYYLVPKNRQWVVLSVASALFYVIGTGGIPVGILFTGVSTWLCGMYLMDSFAKQGQALADGVE